MKRAVLFLAIFTGLLLPAASASAHFIESSNGVHGLLHINPNDNPVAGHKTQLIFYMTDDRGTFSAHNCGCALTIMLHGQAVETSGLRAGNGVLTATFVPPVADAYTMLLRGNAFKLSYDVRVEASSDGLHLVNRGTPVLIMSAASFIILGIIAHTNIKNGTRYATANKEKKK